MKAATRLLRGSVAAPTFRLVLALAATVALAAILAAADARAETAPAGSVPGLRTRSPPAVLDHPQVKRCRALAARRASSEPGLTSIDTAVERAAMTLDVETVLDAVATCRQALAAFPAEPDVVIPHFTASEALSTVLFGLSFPDGDEQTLRLAQGQVPADGRLSGLFGQLLGFYLGSAFEYGIGTPPDPAAARRWYAAGAEAGDPISRRELTRLEGGAR